MILPLFRAQDRGRGDKRPINSQQAEISHGYAPPIVSEHAGNAESAGPSEQPEWIDPRRQQHHGGNKGDEVAGPALRSEEHTSELQSLMRRSYAVYRVKNK